MRRFPSFPWFVLATACVPVESPTEVAEPSEQVGVVALGARVLALPRRGPPVVEVELDGVLARMLVDTGGQFTWLDRDYVRRRSIATEPIDVRLTDANGNEARVREAALVDVLGFDGAEAVGLRPLVLDAIHREVDGALGQDFLRAFQVVLDGPGERLVLLPAEGGAWLEGAFAVPGRAHQHELDETSPIPRVALEVPELGTHLAFVLDTGSEHNTLPQEALRALAPRRVGSYAPIGLAGSALPVGLYELDRLQVGELLLSGLATETPNPSIGWSTLRTVVCVFSARGEGVVLMPGARLRDDWPAAR